MIAPFKKRLVDILKKQGFKGKGGFLLRTRPGVTDVAHIRATINGYQMSLGVVDPEFGAVVDDNDWTWTIAAEITDLVQDRVRYLHMSRPQNQGFAGDSFKEFWIDVESAVVRFYARFSTVQKIREYVKTNECKPQGNYTGYYLDWVLGKGPKWPDTPAAQP